MFTEQERDTIREYIIELAKADPRITAAALVGSTSVDAGDRWSDIDITFAVVDGVPVEAVLTDWTEKFTHELGALHYWDLPFNTSIYRVFLLPNGLEIDASVTPERDYGARGPRFRTLFGADSKYEPPPSTDAKSASQFRYHAGLGWHHILHAHSAIERGKPWQAEYWISSTRDEVLVLACLRLGEAPNDGRGLDRLPAAVTDPLADSLVRSIDDPDLRRALASATDCYLTEVAARDPALASSLRPPLQEFNTHDP